MLPGVTVEASSPALIEKVRTAVTDGTGQYKIIDLRPGTYAVSFSLAGFATVRREEVVLTASFTANVNADMRVGALEETVTVSGATPIVDTQNVAKIATASREVMDVLPTDRNFVSFAALTPSVLVTGVRQNVGGSIPETGMNLVVHGSRASDSLIQVDGMPIINGSGIGRPAVRQLLEQRAGAGDHLPDRLAQRRVRARQRLLELHPEGRVEHLSRLLRRALRRRGLAVGQPRRRAEVEGAAERQPHQPHLGRQPGARRPDHQGPGVDLRLVPSLGHLQHGRRLVQGRGLLVVLLRSRAPNRTCSRCGTRAPRPA